MITYRIKFGCPECKGHRLVERCVTQVFSPVTSVLDFGDSIELDFGAPNPNNGIDWCGRDEISFGCGECGHKIAWDAKETYNWLRDREMIEVQNV